MADAGGVISRAREPWLDSLRVLAVIGVVVQHACISRWMSLTGISWGARIVLGMASCSVACLMLVAGYASALSPAFGKRDRAYILRRLKRLGLPYVVWTAIFLVAQVYLPFGRPAPSLDIMSLVTGTGVYVVLWFLPALFYANLIGWAIRRLRWRLIVGCAFLGLYLFQGSVVGLIELEPTGLFAALVWLSPWFALFLFGQAAASIPADRFTSRGAVATIAAVGVAGIATAGYLSGRYYPVWPSPAPVFEWLTGSVAVFALILAARNRPNWRLLPSLSGVTLAIYIMHLPLLPLLSRLEPAGVVPWYVWVPANVAIAIAVSGGVGALLSRTPLRFLVA